MTFLRSDNAGVVSLSVYVQPRASFNQICGIHDGALRVRLTAPPVEDKANAMLVQFFSKLLKIPKSSITISQGKQSRHKKIALVGVDSGEVEETLRKAIA